MYNEGYRYSLCVVYTGNKGQNIAYRIADYNPDKGVYTKASYTNKYDEYVVFEPSIIGANPADLDLGEACVRRWKPDEEMDQRQRSYSYPDATIFEMVIDSSILQATNEEELVSLMESGIRFPWYVDDKFLLVLKALDDSYEVILCSKKDFIKKDDKYAINSSVVDMLHTTHTFKKYQIEKKDTVSNAQLKSFINNAEFIDNRVFYSFDKLPASSGVFVPRSISSYVITFLKWYCRKEKERVGLTKKEVDRILSLIDSSASSEAELTQFLKDAPFSKAELTKELDRRSFLVKDYLNSENELDAIVYRILKDNPEYYNECVKVATDEWLKKESSIRDQEVEKTKVLIAEREKQESEIRKLGLQLESLNEEVQTERNRLEVLKTELETATMCKESIVAEIASHIQVFERDVVEAVKARGIVGCVFEHNDIVKKEDDRNKTWRELKSNFKMSLEESYPESTVEYYEDLADNISVWFENSAEIAAMIISVFSLRLAVIVPASVGDYLAIAYSLVEDGKEPIHIESSSQWTSIYDVTDVINNSPQRVVYITGVLDEYNENAVSAILRLCPQKHIMFGVNSIDVLKLFSRSMYNNAVLLDIEDYYRFVEASESLYFHPERDWELSIENKAGIDPFYERQLKHLVKAGAISRLHSNIVAKLIDIYQSLYSSSKLGEIMISAIKELCNQDEESQILVDDTLIGAKE